MSATTRLVLAATLIVAPVMTASGLTTPGIEALSRTAPDTAVTSKFDVDGVTVILRRNAANEVIAANLYLLGGARQITPANAGI